MKTLPALYRLTLTSEALALAIKTPKPVQIDAAVRRPDGKFDCFARLAQVNVLKQLAEPKENLSDTLVRVITAEEAERTA